jgi:hypothetical protein
MCVCLTLGGVAESVARDAEGEEGAGMAILGGRVTWLRTDLRAGAGAGTGAGTGAGSSEAGTGAGSSEAEAGTGAGSSEAEAGTGAGSSEAEAGTGAGSSMGREGVTGLRVGMSMGSGVRPAAGVGSTCCRTWTIGGALSAFAFASLRKSFFFSYKSTNLLLFAISVSHPCD